MSDKKIDAMKVRQYVFEKDALEEFLRDHGDRFGFHVKHAVNHRLGIINREMEILSGKPPQKRRSKV